MVPVTVAVKDCVPPCDNVAALGVTVTLTEGSGGGGEVEMGEEVEPPPHPQAPNAAIIRATVLGWNPTFGSDLVRPIVRGDCKIPSSAQVLLRTG